MNEKNLHMYEEFKEHQKNLMGMLSETTQITDKLTMPEEKRKLTDLKEKINSDSFKVQVAGTFKNGKSTFINSLLGEEVLPAYATPCTAVINEIKWGEKKRAVVHFCNPLPERLPSGIPENTMRHMKKYGMKDIPPMEIPYDEVEDYVVIPMGADPSEMLLESPYSKVEIFWPLDLLKNGVEIIDSPGLNEHATRTKVTMDYLAKADAILMVLNATQLCSQQEMIFIEEDLHDNGFDEPFFVVNRFDLVREKEKERVKQFAKLKLNEFTKNQIYFVSALKALEAKEDGDMKAFQESGMEEFERVLTEYLTKNKGKLKLAQPTQELKHIIDVKATDTIQKQENLLEHSLDDVKKMQETIQPKLEELREKKNDTQHKMELDIERTEKSLVRCAEDQTERIVREIETWVEEFEPSTSVTIPTKAKVEAVTNEISAYVSAQIHKSQHEWQKKELEPLIEEKMQDMLSKIEGDISNIFAEIDDININISGEDVKASDVPVWQRIVGAAGGLLIGDVGLAFSAGLNGIGKDFVKTLALEVGAGAVLGFLGLLNPVTLVAILLGSGILNLGSAKKSAIGNIKKEITEKTIESLRSQKRESAQKIASDCTAKFSEYAGGIINAIDAEINDVDLQLQTIIEEKEKGQAEVDARKEELKKYRKQLNDITNRLNEFIMTLINY